MIFCPICRRIYSDDIEFCPLDGAPLATQVTPTEAQLAAGLSRRYRIVGRLGTGGMSTVFLAEQIGVGNRPVALKVLNRKLLDDPRFLLRFQNEAASTGRIRHANVVTIYESGQADDGTPYIAMEYLKGESLREALKRRGALPVPEVAEIFQQAARGLNAAHKLGIIHRDLKPDNIFLTRGDEDERIVKVVDFGIAKLRESATHTRAGIDLGTPAYMSYEQASGMRSDELDARSDVYSLGVVVYEMLTGRAPFRSHTQLGNLLQQLREEPPPFRAVAPDLHVPPEVEGAVMKALVKDRDLRYASALEFARGFTAAASPGEAEPGSLMRSAVEKRNVSEGRHINAWIVDGEPPLEKGRTYQFAINVGKLCEQAIAAPKLLGFDWKDNDELEVWIVLSGLGFSVEPRQRQFTLPKQGDTKPIFFAITVTGYESLLLRISLYFARELTLLQEFEVLIPIKESVQVA